MDGVSDEEVRKTVTTRGKPSSLERVNKQTVDKDPYRTSRGEALSDQGEAYKGAPASEFTANYVSDVCSAQDAMHWSKRSKTVKKSPTLPNKPK